MTGNLIIPLVEVFWGETNLTSYELPGAAQAAPIVFNVSSQLQDGNQNPTGSMEWEPTGPAFAVYEGLLNTALDQQIVVRYYYPGGRSISLVFVWAGQTITYGISMKIVIDLKSELDGLINAAPRSTSSANKNEKPITKVEQLSILTYSAVAEKDMKAAKITSLNVTNQTYAETVNSLVQSNGNTLFPNSIGYAHMAILTPWSYKGEAATEVKVPDQEKVDPTVRYGFLLGPSTISTIERRYVWAPPQQTNTNQVGKAQPTNKDKDKGKGKGKTVTTSVKNPDGSITSKKATTNKDGSVTTVETNTLKKSDGSKVETISAPKTVPANTANDNRSATGGTSAPGVSQGMLQPGVKNEEDKVGIEKQKLNNDENTAKLTVTTFMVPALTGVKPGDILYVPSLGSASDLFIEDWVVHGVTYTQTDGGVTLSIEGARWFGNFKLMQEKPAKAWVEKAKVLNSDPTLAKWQEYAWSLTGTTLPATPATPAATPTTNPLPVPANAAAQAQAEFSTTRTAAIG